MENYEKLIKNLYMHVKNLYGMKYQYLNNNITVQARISVHILKGSLPRCLAKISRFKEIELSTLDRTLNGRLIVWILLTRHLKFFLDEL